MRARLELHKQVGEVAYCVGSEISVDEMIELYRVSTLGERRPVEDRARMAGMLRSANLVISAWLGNILVGIARSMTDFHYATYLSDLAVHEEYQRHGIGRELIRCTRELGGEKASVILLAAPAAEKYYPRVGFTNHASAWILRPGEELR